MGGASSGAGGGAEGDGGRGRGGGRRLLTNRHPRRRGAGGGSPARDLPRRAAVTRPRRPPSRPSSAAAMPGALGRDELTRLGRACHGEATAEKTGGAADAGSSPRGARNGAVAGAEATWKNSGERLASARACARRRFRSIGTETRGGARAPGGRARTRGCRRRRPPGRSRRSRRGPTRSPGSGRTLRGAEPPAS